MNGSYYYKLNKKVNYFNLNIMLKDDIDNNEDVYLIENNEYEQADNTVSYKQKLSNLIQQNKRKQNALQKALSEVQLLNVDLQIKKKRYQQMIRQIKEQCNKKIEKYKLNELKLQQRIRQLQKRNEFLEYEMKKRNDIINNDRKQLKSNRKSSSKSILRQSQAEERKLDTSRYMKSMKQISPKRKTQNNEDENRFSSLQNRYLRKLLQETQLADQFKNKILDDLILRQIEQIGNQQGGIKQKKQQIINMFEDQKLFVGTQLKYYCNLNQNLIKIVKEQQSIISKINQQNNDYIKQVHQFIYTLSNFQQKQFDSIHFNGFQKLISVIAKNIRQKYLKKNRQYQQLKIAKINNYTSQINKISKMYTDLKNIVGSNLNSHQEVMQKLQKLKLAQKLTAQQNQELVNICEGLITYLKM